MQYAHLGRTGMVVSRLCLAHSGRMHAARALCVRFRKLSIQLCTAGELHGYDADGLGLD